MNQQGQLPTRLASEDVIISAPMSYSGSAKRIMRLRRRVQNESALAWVTAACVVLIATAWLFVTVWYLMWGVFLVPYRLIRRGDRKRRAEALRHRELLAALQAGAPPPEPPSEPPPPRQRIGDAERERAIGELRGHMLAGRLSSEEFEQRVDAVQKARTHGEILGVSDDLPAIRDEPGAG